MRIKSSIYHKDCFRCAVCDKTLVAGDEYVIKNIEDGPLCKAHYESNQAVAGEFVQLFSWFTVTFFQGLEFEF